MDYKLIEELSYLERSSLVTVEKLYLYAKERGIEKCEIEIQYADGGGFYYGTRDLQEADIVVKDESYGKVIIL
jgi:hypothetical protein